MKIDKAKLKKYRWLLLFLLFISPGIFQTIQRFIYEKKIKRNGRYTICKIINSEGKKGGKRVEINFQVNGKVYDRAYNGDIGKSWIGEDVFIRYEPSDPTWFIVLEDSILPGKCITAIPENGWGNWDSIPKCKRP